MSNQPEHDSSVPMKPLTDGKPTPPDPEVPKSWHDDPDFHESCLDQYFANIMAQREYFEARGMLYPTVVTDKDGKRLLRMDTELVTMTRLVTPSLEEEYPFDGFKIRLPCIKDDSRYFVDEIKVPEERVADLEVLGWEVNRPPEPRLESPHSIDAVDERYTANSWVPCEPFFTSLVISDDSDMTFNIYPSSDDEAGIVPSSGATGQLRSLSQQPSILAEAVYTVDVQNLYTAMPADSAPEGDIDDGQ